MERGGGAADGVRPNIDRTLSMPYSYLLGVAIEV
jgi:hypothetical protein